MIQSEAREFTCPVCGWIIKAPFTETDIIEHLKMHPDPRVNRIRARALPGYDTIIVTPRDLDAIIVGARGTLGSSLASNVESKIAVGKNDSYSLEELIAIGGLSEVYKARSSSNNTAVAIKLPRKDMEKYSGTCIAEERKTLSRLSNENVIQLLDEVKLEDGREGLVFEFIPNLRSLDAYYGKPASTIEVLKILRQLIPTVGYLHSIGVIHCDLKPGNIILTSDGTLKITDFGIGLMLSSDQELVAGTPSWSAPEQFNPSRTIAPVVDIYSIGAIAFFLLTGEVPNETVNSPKSPNPKVSDFLSRFVEICVDKDPNKRFQDTDSMLSYLDKCPDCGCKK